MRARSLSLRVTAGVAAGLVAGGIASAQKSAAWLGVLDEHPSIAYATTPPTDRVAKLGLALAEGGRSLPREPRTGYLRALLDALGLPVESQLLVFSKTGVQRAHTSPRTPRALYFDDSVVVGYVAGAPVIELAAHDAQQGVVFYTLEQSAAAPRLTRKTTCLACHVSASTLNVPGILVRSNTVDPNGDIVPHTGSNHITHETPHPDRWGGWFVTSDPTSIPYAQRAHAGNIAFEGQGVTSNQVFVEWVNGEPETRGYLSASSDIAALLAFDHQMHAVNLLTRLNWEARVAAAAGVADLTQEPLRGFVNE